MILDARRRDCKSEELLTMTWSFASSTGGPGILTLNLSPLEGSTFPLSGRPGAAVTCSAVGRSNASASARFDEISGPVVISFSELRVAVSSSFVGVVEAEAEVGAEGDADFLGGADRA